MFKIVGIFFVLMLIGGIGSAYFLFETKTGNTLLFKGVHTYLKSIEIDLTLEGLEGDFPKNFSLHFIELKDSASQKPLIQGEQLHLSWDWTSLFQGRLVFKTFTIQKLSLFSVQDTSLPKPPHQIFQEVVQKIQLLFSLPYFVKIEDLVIQKGLLTLEDNKTIDFHFFGHIDFNIKEKGISLEAEGLSLPWKGIVNLQGKENKSLEGHLLFEDPEGIFLKDYGPFKSRIDIASHQNGQINGSAVIDIPSLGEGTLHWEGIITKNLEIPFEGHITPAALLMEQESFLSPITFQGNFFAQGDLLQIKDIAVTASYGSLQIPTLKILPFEEQEIETHFNTSQLPLAIPATLQPFLPLETLEGVVFFSIPENDKEIIFKGGITGGESLSLISTGKISTLENILHFDSLTFKTIGATLEGNGDIYFKPEGISLSLPLTFSISPQDIYPLNTADTPLTGTVHLEGPLSHLSFQSEVDLPFIEWEGESFSTLSLTLKGWWAENQGQVTPILKGVWKETPFTLQSSCMWEKEKGITLDSFFLEHSALRAQGSFFLSENSSTKGQFHFEGQSFPFLKDVFFDRMQGKIAWDEKGIKGEASGNQGDLFGTHLDSLTLNGISQNWQGKDLSFSLEASTLKVGAVVLSSLKLSGKGDLEKESSFLKGTLLISTPTQKDVEIPYSYTKKLEKSTLTLSSFKGTLGKLDISLPKDFVCTYTPLLIDIPKTNFLINKNALTLFFTKKEDSLKGALSFTIFPLKDLQGISSVFQLPLVLKKGEVLLSGALQDPTLSYKVSIEPAPSSDGWGPAIPMFSGQIQGMGRHHLLEGSISLTTPNALEYIKGTWKIPFENKESIHKNPLTLSFEGKGSLATIAPFIVEQGDLLKGSYQAAFTVKGSYEKPLIQGHLNIEKGTYQNFKFGTLFQDVALQLNANNTSLTILQGTAYDAQKGTLVLSGSYAWGGENSTLLATLTNFQIVALDMVNGLATGTLSLQKDAKVLPTLTGMIQLEPLAVHIPKKLPPHIYTFDVKRIGKESTTPQNIKKEEHLLLKDISIQTQNKIGIRPLPPFTEEESIVLSSTKMPPIPLALQVTLPNKFTVEGFGLSSSWEGKVQVGGTLQDPNLQGTIHIQKGSFASFGKTFSLQKGYLLFTGQSTLDPDADIVAQITTAGITANILISGKLSKPQFTLTSNPTLPPNEIIARILFGKDMGSLSPFQSLQIVSALSDLTGTANPTSFVDQIRDSLGLGGLSFAGDGGSGSGLSLGKYLSDDIFVNLEQGFDEESTKASVEVKIFPEVTLQSDVGADSSAGIGLNWRYEY